MTYTRTAAIARARKESRINLNLVSGKWYIAYWESEVYNRFPCASHHAARTIRAQILIDTTLDLLGLTAEIQYTGGSWTTYIPKVTP